MHTHLTFAIRLFEFSFSVAETRTTLIGSMSYGTIVKKNETTVPESCCKHMEKNCSSHKHVYNATLAGQYIYIEVSICVNNILFELTAKQKLILSFVFF